MGFLLSDSVTDTRSQDDVHPVYAVLRSSGLASFLQLRDPGFPTPRTLPTSGSHHCKTL